MYTTHVDRIPRASRAKVAARRTSSARRSRCCQHHHRRLLHRAHDVAGGERAGDAAQRHRGARRRAAARHRPKSRARRAQARRATRAASPSRTATLLFAALPHVVDRTHVRRRWAQDVAGDAGAATRTDLVAADGGFLDLVQHAASRAGAASPRRRTARHAKVCVVGAQAGARSCATATRSGTLARRSAAALPRHRAAGRTRTAGASTSASTGSTFVVLPLDTLARRRADGAAGAAMLVLKTDDAAAQRHR